MNYTDTQLIQLAQTNSKELIRLLNSPNTNTRVLTSGAEILGGEVTDEAVVLPVLRMLLKHVHANVREGAAIGVSSFFLEKKPPQDILDRLQVMSRTDPSPAIKTYTKAILKDFELLTEG